MNKKVRINGNKIEIGNTIISGLNNDLLEYIKDLQKKAELGEHYKYLYSEVKKQKDDVVEYIKNIARTDDYLDGISCDDLLRMLGEIDE